VILPDNRFTVILDANVMYPFLIRDLLLRFFEMGLFKARWTDEITEEWVRSLKKNQPKNADNIDATKELIHHAFPDAIVTDYSDLISALCLPDPDDRHVLAAAIKCGADYIVTENLRDFPVSTLAKYGIEAGTADQFLTSTFDLFQQDVISDMRQHRLGLRDKPAASEYIMMLRQGKLPQLASRVLDQKNLI
jgi:predicted nucleic acid-binding protein